MDSVQFWAYEGLGYLKREKVDDSQLMGKQYNFISYIHGIQGHKIEAINYADSAILFLESQDTLTKDIQYSYGYKGQMYQSLGDFYRANTALEMALYIADHLKEQKALILNDLGINELRIGNLNTAEVYFNQLISDEDTPQQLRIIGRMNLTQLYLDLGNLDKAKEAWVKVDTYINSSDIKDKSLVPDFFQIKAELLQAEGYQLQGIKSLKKAIELLEKQPHEKRKAEKFRCELVKLLLEKSVEEAQIECRKAYQYFTSQNRDGKDPFKMVATHLIASCFYEQYKANNQISLLDSCLQYCKKAQEISDELRNGFLYRNSKYLLAKYLKANIALGIDAANEFLEEGEIERGQELFFYFMEKGKSQVLLDDLDEKQKVRLKKEGLLEKLYMLELKKMEAKDSTERIKLSMQVEKARSELKNEMHDQEGFFQPDLNRLIRLSKQFNTVFLEFGEGTEYPYVLMVNDGHVSQKQIAVSNDSLGRLIKRHLLHLKTPTIPVTDYAITANKLYNLLLEPFAIEKRNIVVIPSELIGYLQFASLTMNSSSISSYKKLPYAIEKWEFSYAFSSAFLPGINSDVKQSFCGLLPVNQDEGDLSLHEELIYNVKKKFSGESFQKDTNLTLSSISEQYDFIHISSHGTFSIKDPTQSYLFMPGSDSSKLTIQQLHSTAMNNTPFVVLNACQTGEGEIRSGEGIDNFTRAFFYSGASGVIESSWKINANQTAVIFNSFYNFLLEGLNTKASLREAKLTYLKDQNTDNHFAHPYYWAGFRHFGTSVTFQEPASKIPYWWIISAGVIFLILGFLWWSRH